MRPAASLQIPTAVTLALALFAVNCITACGGGGGGASSSVAPVVAGVGGSTQVPSVTGDITLLFMGNSHTAFNDVPNTVAAMVRAVRPGKTVGVANAPGSMFLEERVADATTTALLKSRQWSAIVLQAQKISSSGLFTYSTAEAVQLVRQSREQGALPVMFSEWPRAGIPETQTIYDIYVSIARAAPACVAPIGQAWDLSLARQPALTLHDSDGNHSRPPGAFLAALVIFATLTQESPRRLPDIAVTGVDAATQAFLRGIAAETVETISPRLWCVNDKTI